MHLTATTTAVFGFLLGMERARRECVNADLEPEPRVGLGYATPAIESLCLVDTSAVPDPDPTRLSSLYGDLAAAGALGAVAAGDPARRCCNSGWTLIYAKRS